MGHISRFDTSPYGHVGDFIEKLQIAPLAEKLVEIKKRKQSDQINISKGGKTLLDLALDNLEIVPSDKLETAKNILNELLESEVIDANKSFKDKGNSHFFLEHLIDLISKTTAPQLKEYLVSKIDESVLSPDKLSKLKPAEFDKAIKVLRENNKNEFADKAIIINAVRKGNYDLVAEIARTNPALLQTKIRKGNEEINLLKVAALKNHFGIQQVLIANGVPVDFQLRIEKKETNYLGNLIYDSGNPGVIGLMEALIDNKAMKDLLNENHIKAIYLGAKKRPPVVGFESIFNKLLDKGFLNEYLEVKLETAGMVAGVDFTVRDYALKNLDVPKLNVLLQTDSLEFAHLSSDYKIRVIELFSKNYNELDDSKVALKKQVLNAAVKLNQWDSLGKLIKDGSVDPNELGLGELGEDELRFTGFYQDQIAQLIKILSENCDKLQGADSSLRKEILANAVSLQEWEALDALLKAGIVNPNQLGGEGEHFARLTDEQKSQLVILFSKNPEKLKGISPSYKKEILDNAVALEEWGALDALLKADIVNPKDLGDNAEIVISAYLNNELEGMSDESLVKLMKVNLNYALVDNFVVLDQIESAGFTMLHAAVLNKDVKVLDELLKVDKVKTVLNKTTEQGLSPYAIAQFLGDEAASTKLIGKGATFDQVKQVGLGMLGKVFGNVSVQTTNPLLKALKEKRLDLAFTIVSADTYLQLGETKDIYAIYDLLINNIEKKQCSDTFDVIIQKGLFPLDLKVKKETIALDFAQKMIQEDKPQLLGELIAYLAKTIESDKQELKALENASGVNINELKKKFQTNIDKNSKYLANIASLISKSEKFKDNKGKIVEFSEGLLKVKDNVKNDFAQVFVRALVEAKHYEALAELKSPNKDRANLLDPVLVSKVETIAKGEVSRLFTLNNPQGKDLLNILLDYSSKEEVNKLDANGTTMLHYACRNGQVGLAKKLVAHGADKFALQTDTGMTPLMNTGMTPLMMLAVSDDNDKATEIFQEFLKDKDFVEALKERSGLLEKSGEKGKEIVAKKPVEYMHIMLALKKGNIGLANEFIKALKPQRKGEGKDRNSKYKANKAEFKKIRAQIHTNILYRALLSDDTELVTNFLKLESSKDFNPSYITVSVTDEGKTEKLLLNPLFIALRSNNIKMLNALLDSPYPDINLNSIDRCSGEKHSLLQEAMKYGKTEAVKALLERNNKETDPKKALMLDRPSVKGEESLTPMNLAYNNAVGLEKELLNLANALEAEGLTAEKKQEIETKITEKEKDINNIYQSMGVLLTYNQGNKENASKRININASLTVNLNVSDNKKSKVNILTHSYQRLMEEELKGESANKEKIEQIEKLILNILLNKDVDVDITNQYGQNLLMLAAQQGDAKVVAAVALNKSSPNVSQTDHLGNTALMYAAQSGNTATYRYLIDEGATPTANKEGVNLLMAASNGGHSAIVKILKPTTHDMKVRDKAGNTALHYLVTNSEAFKSESEAKKGERDDILDEFIKLEADINAQNAKGETPLLLAVLSGDERLVRKLIESGADVNIADKDGNTPLIYASLLNNEFVISALLESNALQVNQKNKDGVSAYIIAASRQGLEHLRKAPKSQEEAGGKDKSKAKEVEDIEKVIQPNNYPKYVETLIARGADPYESDPNPFLINVAKTIAIVTALSAANHYAFQSAPIAKEIGTTMNGIYAGREIFKTVEEKTRTTVRDFFNNDTVRDMRVDINEHIMIGSFHDNGIFGRMVYGESLHSAVNSHSNFKKQDGDGGGIFTAEALRRAAGDKGAEWQIGAHEMLLHQYVNVTETINKRPWYYKFPLFWKTMALNRIAAEILEADKHLLNGENERKVPIATTKGSKDATFEEAIAPILQAINSPRDSRRFMKYILELPVPEGVGEDGLPKPKPKTIEQIINAVANNQVIVSPDTFVAFLKFSQQLNYLKRHENQKAEFLAANRRLANKDKVEIENNIESFTKEQGSELDNFIFYKTRLDEFAQAQKTQIMEEIARQNTVPRREKLLNIIASGTGTKKEDIVNAMSKTAGTVMGAGAAVATAMAVDGKIYQVLAATGVAVTALPVAAIGSVVVAGAAGLAAIAASVTVAGKLASLAKSAWNALPARGAADQQEKPVTPQTVSDASKLESSTQNLLAGNLSCNPIVHEVFFDIQPSPQLAVSLTSPKPKTELQQMASVSPVALAKPTQNANVQQQPGIVPPALAPEGTKATISAAVTK